MSYVLFFREFFVHEARKPVFTADSVYSRVKHFLNWRSWNCKKEGAQKLKLWNWVLTQLGWVRTFTEVEILLKVLLSTMLCHLWEYSHVPGGGVAFLAPVYLGLKSRQWQVAASFLGNLLPGVQKQGRQSAEYYKDSKGRIEAVELVCFILWNKSNRQNPWSLEISQKVEHFWTKVSFSFSAKYYNFPWF